MQTQHYAGSAAAADAAVAELAAALPDSLYLQAATTWLERVNAGDTAEDACAEIAPIFADNADLWQITDHFGYNHPALAAEQVCFVP